MPLSGPSSYVPTLRGFMSHWQAVDDGVGSAFEISDPQNPSGARLGVGVIGTLMEELQEHERAISGYVADGDVADSVLAEAKAAALALAQEFGRYVRAEGQLRHLVSRLPELPKVTDGEGVFMNAMTSVRQRWKLADGFLNGPLVLASGESSTAFAARLVTLGDRFEAAEEFDVLATMRRKMRDETQGRVREILSSYRAAVEARFAPDHPYVESLPRIYPSPGRTPDAVSVTAVWVADAGKARLTWKASTEKDLSHYEVRGSHAASGYSTEDERVLGRIEKEALLEYLTDDGLSNPGSTGRYKVYVVLNTGNERGSEAVTVVRA